MISAPITTWETMTLAEAGVSLIDCVHKTPPAQETGIPYIAIPQMKEGHLDFASARKISEADFIEWTRKALPQVNDVVLSRRCNPGTTATVKSENRFALGQNLVLLRADGTRVYPQYLQWLTQGPAWWNEINRFLNVGAVFDSLRCADVPRFELLLPPPDEQRAIASVLGSLDDKIELNRRMNRTLEQMAAAIFKAWFVDFDPVRAKANGAPAFPGMPQPAYDALPTTFQDSPLGPIPKGWEVKLLKDAVRLTMGQSPKSEFYNDTGDGLPFHQGVTNYGERFPIHKQFCTVDNRIAEPGDILFSVRAPVGRINVADEKLIVGRGLAAIRHHENWQSLLLYALKHQFAEEDSIGDGTIFKAVTKKDMENIRLIQPAPDIGKAYEQIASTMDQQIGINDRESRTLAETRDALLPKLLNGEIRIN